MNGIYNIVGDERVSKKQFGLILASYYKLPSDLIVSAKINEYGLNTIRPLDMSLDNSKIKNVIRKKLGSINRSLETIDEAQKNGRQIELNNSFRESFNE